MFVTFLRLWENGLAKSSWQVKLGVIVVAA